MSILICPVHNKLGLSCAKLRATKKDNYSAIVDTMSGDEKCEQCAMLLLMLLSR